jgi:hypothetical protein
MRFNAIPKNLRLTEVQPLGQKWSVLTAAAKQQPYSFKARLKSVQNKMVKVNFIRTTL